MSAKCLTTNEIDGLKVFGGKNNASRIGKVRSFVFHPTKLRVLGFTVKRPDVALMFHRGDMFVPLDGFVIKEQGIFVREGAATTGPDFCKRNNINWDCCVLWVGMPVVAAKTHEDLGLVSNVKFNRETGEVISVDVDKGIASSALLGKLTIPAKMVRGFRPNIGSKIVQNGYIPEDEDEQAQCGGILVSSEAANLKTKGGAAAAAGQASAVAADKIKTSVSSATKPVAEKASKAGNSLVNEGSFKAGKEIGKQIDKSKHMFKDFAVEYHKAAGTATKKNEKQVKTTTAIKNTTKKMAPKMLNFFSDVKNEYKRASRGK